MRGESRPRLLDRDPMTLLLPGASLNPALNIRGVARVLMEPSANVVEAGPQHPDVTVDRSCREVTRAAALVEASASKPLTAKRMDLRSAALAPEMEKPEDVQRRGLSEGRGRGTQRRTNRTDGQKLLEVRTKRILLLRILRVADV